MRFSMIGNGSYQALVDDHARVTWLCWPRFDSDFVFGSLLDEERGGVFSIEPTETAVKPTQAYVGHSAVVRTEFHMESGSFEVTDFAPRFEQYGRFFKPNMLVRRVRPLQGQPRVVVTCDPVCDEGRTRPTAHAASNHIQWDLAGEKLRLTTNVPLTYVQESRPFLVGQDVYFVLTHGAPLEAPLEETCEHFLRETLRYWESWVRRLSLPGEFQDAVVRSAVTLKIHQYADTGAITAAATTSLPEADGEGRNWDYRYCWVRDACFTVNALVRLGHFEELEGLIGYLENVGAGEERKIQPVYGISGRHELPERELPHLTGYRGNKPVRVGNGAWHQVQHDVYGEMVLALAPLFFDLRFSERAHRRRTGLVARLLDRIEATVDEPDVGLWEKRDEPRIHTFTQLMHWVGARIAARVASDAGDEAEAARARSLMAKAGAHIESAWRPNLGFYADATDTDHPDASLFMLVNLGYLEPDHARAALHVERTHARLQAGADHLISRYLHDDGLGATTASFTLCGWWYVEALARLGEQDQARRIFEALLGHGNHVGLMSEDIDPRSGEQWGNFPQCYSHVGLINAAFALAPFWDPLEP